MPKGNKQKYKLFYLAQILLEKTDDTHFLTVKQIIDELAKYEVIAERKSLYHNLTDDLEIIGLDVEAVRKGRNNYYHVVNRSFELAELKLLVDVVQASRFFTEVKTNTLIKKLQSSLSIYERGSLWRQVYVTGRVKANNEMIYYNVDVVHRAINDNRKIYFQYFQWNIRKEPVLKYDGKIYVVSPIGLVWDNENYYMVGLQEDEGKVKHYRVDKMVHSEMAEQPRINPEWLNSFNIAEYAKRHFSMFGGEEALVALKAKNEFAGIMLDRFGNGIEMIPLDDTTFTLRVRVQMSSHFIGWIFSLGDGVEIIGPADIREKVRKEVERLSDVYLI